MAISKETLNVVLWAEARITALTREWEAGLSERSPHDARERMRMSTVCPTRNGDGPSQRRTTMFERYRAEAKGDESFGAFVRRVGAKEGGAC